ncbi:MAG: SagB/ThcOx family dehydrogenase [Acidilobaceae archaeon]
MVSRRFFVISLLLSILSSMLIPPAILGYARRLLAFRFPDTYGGYAIGDDIVDLPLPSLTGLVSVEEALASRRSIREYLPDPLTIVELSQILWASYGVTEFRYGFKTTPSAGATYPLNVYVVVYPRSVVLGNLSYLTEGSYIYIPEAHRLKLVKRGDLSRELYKACLEQEWILRAKAVIVITAIYERTTRRYGDRGVRYVWIEVGHAGQNIYLQATALQLATVAIGAFHDNWVREVIGAPVNEHTLYVMPIAKPAWRHKITREQLASYIGKHRL